MNKQYTKLWPVNAIKVKLAVWKNYQQNRSARVKKEYGMSTTEQIQEIIDRKKVQIARLQEANRKIRAKKIKGMSDDTTIKNNRDKIEKLKFEIENLERQKRAKD